MGEAAERLVLATKEPAENLTDVGVDTTIAETNNGGTLHTCTIDNGRGTENSDALPVPPCYVISKTKVDNDPNLTLISGPCGEVPVVALLALRAETSIRHENNVTGIYHATEGGE